ncbi:alpha/beta hydrolase [Streptomyces sp. XH2]|uniref:alpha/beta hydrolase n=1 Tax=Streptomyces sp. XH2 TaxID=3412483 RepID=UPI003C7C7D52
MRRSAALGAAGALVTGTLIAGAGTAGAAAPSLAGHRQDAVERGVRAAADRAAEAGVDWQDCPADWGLAAPVQCGWVSVPLDYARPGGRTIKIAVDRVAHTGGKDERQGALVYNPGGPGASGLLFPMHVVGKTPVWAKTARAYDFVGFDPRGVGRSAPVSCQAPEEFAKAPKPDPVPGSEADKRALRKRAEDYAAGCFERSGDLLPHLTTADTARDLDVIRAALGEKRLNYLGTSYGTYLGAVYATLFPGHVRRMVADSVVNPSRDKIWYGANLGQDVAFERRWTDWKTWVAGHDAAYHLGSTAAEVQTRWEKLRAAAAKKPIGGTVGPAELTELFQNAPYYDFMWDPIAAVWSAYAAGNEALLVAAAGAANADAVAAENANAAYTAVQCADAPWPTAWRTWDRDATRLHRQAPFMTWSNTWKNLPCATWPAERRPTVEVTTGKGLPPVLIVQSARDAAAPYDGAVELHKRLKGSRLITERDAGSHGVTDLTNPCVNDRVDAYFLTGRTDDADVTCAPHAAPEPAGAGSR